MFDKVSRAKDYACIEVEGSRDPSVLLQLYQREAETRVNCKFKHINYYFNIYSDGKLAKNCSLYHIFLG